VGDEPLLIFTATKAPVCVAPDRVAAAKKLIELGCTHILSDDGLQHYQLGRSLEIAVVDGERLFGNGYRLPSGPLREPLSRLNTVDMIVVNSGVATTPSLAKFKNTYSMQIQPLGWHHLVSNKLMQLQDVAFQSPIFAVAGIGNPERYFKTLSALSLTFKPMSFADHHAYQLEDFSICAESDVVMTEKDAVKCAAFARQNWYALSVGAQLDSHFWQDFQTKLDSLSGS
jgi:tetraacyldisaccharide 4'-kinase